MEGVGIGVLLGKVLGRLMGIWRDSMLLCRPESLGYMRLSLGTLKPLISSRPWEKLAELILRMGAGLGVKQAVSGAPVVELGACSSGTLEAWPSVDGGRSRLLELTLSRLAREGGLTKLLDVALEGRKTGQMFRAMLGPGEALWKSLCGLLPFPGTNLERGVPQTRTSDTSHLSVGTNEPFRALKEGEVRK